MLPKFNTIDEYLTTLTKDRRTALARLRKTIRSIIPKTEECFSYGMPAFRLNGAVVAGFIATRQACSYFPFSGRTLTTLADEVSGYEQTKGSLHFDPDKPLPVALVRKLIRTRIAEQEQRKARSPRAPKTGVRRRSRRLP